MRISYWSSDVCSSDLVRDRGPEIAHSEKAKRGPLLLAAEPPRNVGGADCERAAGQPQPQRPDQDHFVALCSRQSPGRGGGGETVLKSEEGRAGRECVRTCRTGWWTDQ